MALKRVIRFFQTKLNMVLNFHDVDNGHQVFPNQSEFGLESAFCKIISFFPNQTGIGLENLTQFLGVTFPNQTGFGLEKDTE